MRTLMPLMVKMGLTTEKDIDIETLADRMRDEAVQARAFFIPINLVGAFGCTKASDRTA